MANVFNIGWETVWLSLHVWHASASMLLSILMSQRQDMPPKVKNIPFSIPCLEGYSDKESYRTRSAQVAE